MTAPYWEDDHVQLYLGRMEEVLPALGLTADLIVADPPYAGSTLEAARLTGRKAIGIEAHEPYAEAAARRLAQAPLELT